MRPVKSPIRKMILCPAPEMAHLVHDHGMAQVQVRGGGVKTYFHAQGDAPRQFFAQFALVDKLGHATFNGGHLAVDIRHGAYPCGKTVGGDAAATAHGFL